MEPPEAITMVILTCTPESFHLCILSLKKSWRLQLQFLIRLYGWPFLPIELLSLFLDDSSNTTVFDTTLQP